MQRTVCDCDYCGDRLDTVEVCVATPIASPDTTMFTRRFCARPLAVVLSATGLFLPKPADVMLVCETPCDDEEVLHRGCAILRQLLVESSEPTESV